MRPPRQMQYRDQEATTTPWVAIFVLLSILAHVVVFIIIALMALFVPPVKFKALQLDSPTVSLSLMPQPLPPKPKPPEPPKPPASKPKPPEPIPNPAHTQGRPLVDTVPQEDTIKPPKNAAYQSENNTQFKSDSTTSRDPNSTLPDVVTKDPNRDDHNFQKIDPRMGKLEPPSLPTPQKPTEEVTKESSPAPQNKPQPVQTAAAATDVVPAKTSTAPKPAKPQTAQNAVSQVDPVTGLPVLPPIDAPVLAPPTPSNSTQASKTSKPSAIAPLFAGDIQGRQGLVSGSASPDSVASEAGRYTSKVSRAVASRWYMKTQQAQSLLSVGRVVVQYTISADGTVTTKVLEGDNNPSLQILVSICVNSIRESGPFDSFSEGMIKSVGTSYTGTFNFSIY